MVTKSKVVAWVLELIAWFVLAGGIFLAVLAAAAFECGPLLVQFGCDSALPGVPIAL